MAGSIEAVKHLSKDLGIKEDALIREGIIEYIKSRIKACMRDKLEIISRYKVSSLEEFERKVKEGSILNIPAGRT